VEIPAIWNVVARRFLFLKAIASVWPPVAIASTTNALG